MVKQQALKKIVFVTSTRADFGKIKSLVSALQHEPWCEVYLFVTGMHLVARHGSTVNEIVKFRPHNMHRFDNGAKSGDLNVILGNTCLGLSRYVREIIPDLIVVHGDRVEALAGALTGSLNSIPVVHIEGGEVSGTVDEHIRHSVSKMAHIHLVANTRARKRLIQMGEDRKNIFVIGSADLDIMASPSLPQLGSMKRRYAIPFEHYGIVLFHPVVTELAHLRAQTNALLSALIESGRDHVVIYPNNDPGSDTILKAYKKKLSRNPHFRLLPSMRFEHFLTLMKHADYMIGNSSAGIREAPFYGLPSIDLGSRQRNRLEGRRSRSVHHLSAYDPERIIELIRKLCEKKVRYKPAAYFGDGKSDKRFLELCRTKAFWAVARQKRFIDL